MKNKILLIALSVLIFSCNQEVKTENNKTQENIDVKTPIVKVVRPEMINFTSNL